MQPASGVWGQLEVLNALVLREMKTRFGKHQLGYLWCVIEPSLWIVTFVFVFEMSHRTAPNGMDTVSFIATGLVPYMLFRECATRAMNAIGSNRGLLFYPQIQPLDLVFARTVLEFFTLVLVFGVIVSVASIFTDNWPHVADWLEFGLGFCAAAALGTCFGLFSLGLSVFLPVVERLYSPLLRPMFWFSGIFFTANGLPAPVRDVMLYNPLLHIIEFVRTGWFLEYRTLYGSPSYVLTWILALGFLGLVTERVARRRLEVQ